jgi:RimJ/RimL family protein N-acetyltransferase
MAVERRADGALVGGAGLSNVEDLPFGPTVEIGWILGRAFWRQGYGAETGRAFLAHGWSIGLTEIVGYTSEINQPSRRLMAALGMRRDAADDFLDPTVPAESPLSPHVLYRIARWPAARAAR